MGSTPGLSSIAYKTYFIFGTFNFAAFIHILFCFPETAGRTLEEIEDVFSQGHLFTAWKVSRTVGQKTLEQVRAEKADKGEKDADSSVSSVRTSTPIAHAHLFPHSTTSTMWRKFNLPQVDL